MKQNMKTCAFAGHRPKTLSPDFCEADEQFAALKQMLRDQIVRLIEEEGVNYFITGMTLGVGIYAAEIVLDLKSQYPNLKLECAIPCETQAVNWSNAMRERYYDIGSQCDRETMLQTRYTPDCAKKQSKYMVDHTDCLLTVWNGGPGRTGSMVKYALEQGKPVYRIDPVTLSAEKWAGRNSSPKKRKIYSIFY